MKLNDAYKQLEKLNIEKDTKIKELKVKEAAQSKKVDDLIKRFDANYYDESVPSVEVACQQIEIDRAKRALDQMQTELYDLENFGICPEQDDFMKVYSAGMDPIIKEIGKIDFQPCIDTLRGYVARLEKANTSLIEYHRAVIHMTGSGATQTKDSELYLAANAEELQKLNDVIKALNALKPILDTRIMKLETNGHALGSLSGFSTDCAGLPDGDLYEFGMYADHNPDFKKGDKVIYSKKTGRAYTRPDDKGKGRTAYIPFETMFGVAWPGPFGSSGSCNTWIKNIDKESI